MPVLSFPSIYLQMSSLIVTGDESKVQRTELNAESNLSERTKTDEAYRSAPERSAMVEHLQREGVGRLTNRFGVVVQELCREQASLFSVLERTTSELFENIEI